MLLFCYTNLVKFEKLWLSKIFKMTYNLERMEQYFFLEVYYHHRKKHRPDSAALCDFRLRPRYTRDISHSLWSSKILVKIAAVEFVFNTKIFFSRKIVTGMLTEMGRDTNTGWAHQAPAGKQSQAHEKEEFYEKKKSHFCLPQLWAEFVFPSRTTKPSVQPPQTHKTVQITSLSGLIVRWQRFFYFSFIFYFD